MGESLLGSRIGHVRFVDTIATGGMGEVYAGFDETLQRKVALKGIRREFHFNEEAKLRFLREARVLSQMGHPNICQIHDYLEGGQSDFIVMELVEGKNLKQAMKKGLDEREKMRIAEQVVDVLVAAHERGIIHRDLKPDNIMLAEGNLVKVLDFGLSRQASEDVTAGLSGGPSAYDEARAVTQPEDDGTQGLGDDIDVLPASGSSAGLTRVGAIMGTLGYMSPEQARGEVATGASDMYSFGLVLQELFSGTEPYERGLTAAELLEKTRKGETKPFSGVDSDLTALIGRLKSLEPAARPSAVDAAEKLEWIRRKPRRRRQRTLVAATIVVLLAFGATMTVQSIRATRAERRAREEAEIARRISGFLVDLFTVSDPDEARGKTITAREILDVGSARIESGLTEQPLVRARLMHTMGTVYMGLGLYSDAEPLLTNALKIREKLLGPTHPDVATNLSDLATLYFDQGRFTVAEPLCLRALAIREKAFGPDHPDVAHSLNDLATFYWNQADYAKAEPLIKRALAIREETFGPDHPDVASSLNRMADIYLSQGKYAEVEPLFKRALSIREKNLGPDHPEVAISINNLAWVYSDQGRYGEAEQLHRRALAIMERVLGPEHPDVAGSLNNLANLLLNQGTYPEAEQLLKRSLDIREKSLGPDHYDISYTLNNLAAIYMNQGRSSDAEPLYRRSLAIREKAHGPDHPEVANCLSYLVTIHIAEGNIAEAELLSRRVLSIRETAFGPRRRETALAHRALAQCEFQAKRYTDAYDRLVLTLEIGRELARTMPENQNVRFLVGSSLLLKGRTEEAMGRESDARSSWTEAFTMLEPVAMNAPIAEFQDPYIRTLLCLGRIEQARPLVAKLLGSGYRTRDFLEFCRQRGLDPAGIPDLAR